MFLHGSYAICRGLGGGERSDGGNARKDSGATNGLLVEDRILAPRGVYDELNAAFLDEVDGIGAALVHFEDALDDETRGFEDVGCAFSGNDFEAEIDVAAREGNDRLLVVIVDGEKHCAAGG